uniref:Peroxin-19 n=1 Tax=Globodera pallida TaxID=36090 RepID=A0A183C1M5_GLOPA
MENVKNIFQEIEGMLKNDDWTKHPEELLKSMLANHSLNFEKSERKMEEILTELTTVAETTATKTSAKSLSPEKAQTVQAVHKVLQLIEQQLEVGPAKNALKQFLGKDVKLYRNNKVGFSCCCCYRRSSYTPRLSY